MVRFSYLSGLVFALCLIGANAPAHAGTLAGSWSGSGTVKSALGQSERARCRVSYTKSSDNSYRMKANCGMTSGRALQVATLRRTGGNKFSGSFRNAKHNINGTIRVTLRGNRQTIWMSAAEGSATIKLTRR